MRIRAGVFGSSCADVRCLRAILGREHNPVHFGIRCEFQVIVRARAVGDGQLPIERPGALGVETLQGFAVLNKRVAIREVGPCHLEVAIRNGLGVVPIWDNSEREAGLQVAGKIGILESKGDRDDVCGCVGIVLRKDQVHFQGARGGLGSPSASQKERHAGAKETHCAREVIHD